MPNEEMLAQIAALGSGGIMLLIALLIVLALPVFMVMVSKRTQGGRKIFWVLMMGTFSWLAYPPYLMFTGKPDQAADQPPPAG